jgi:hypothetical protein
MRYVIIFLTCFVFSLQAQAVFAPKEKFSMVVQPSTQKSITKISLKDEIIKENSKLAIFAKKLIAKLDSWGIPNKVEGYELFGALSLALIFVGLLASMFIAPLGLLLLLSSFVAALLAFFNVIQDRSLKGKGLTYAAIALFGLFGLTFVAAIVFTLIAVASFAK